MSDRFREAVTTGAGWLVVFVPVAVIAAVLGYFLWQRVYSNGTMLAVFYALAVGAFFVIVIVRWKRHSR